MKTMSAEILEVSWTEPLIWKWLYYQTVQDIPNIYKKVNVPYQLPLLLQPKRSQTILI